MAYPYYPPPYQPFYPPTATPPPPPPTSSAAQPTVYPPAYPVFYTPPPSIVPAESPAQVVISNPIPVIGSQYCLPRPVELNMKKRGTLTDDFVVTDTAKSVIFKVKDKFLSAHDKRVLFDAAGTPILTLTNKILTAHNRWQVFRGTSTYPADLIFSAKTSSMIQLKTKLHVFLANRKSEDFYDFRVEGSWSEDSCVVYVGETTIIAAEMNKKDNAAGFFLGKDTLKVTVNPNVDYAFIVCLIVILDSISSLTSEIATVANLVI